MTDTFVRFLEIAARTEKIKEPDVLRRIIDWHGKILAAGLTDDDDDLLRDDLEQLLALVVDFEIEEPSFHDEIAIPEPKLH